MTCFLVGFALVFLTANPTKAYACNVSCYAWTCELIGDVICNNGQYEYLPMNGLCPTGLPQGCSSGGGSWYWELVDGETSCTLKEGACYCPYSGAQYWEVYSGC